MSSDLDVSAGSFCRCGASCEFPVAMVCNVDLRQLNTDYREIISISEAIDIGKFELGSARGHVRRCY
jgi:hypothetical protein